MVKIDQNVMIKILTISDLEQIKKLYSSQKTHMKISSPFFSEQYIDTLLINEYLNEQFENKILIGFFLNGTLALSLGMYFWPQLPSCTFLRFCSLDGFFNGKDFQQAFRSLLSRGLDELERRNYNRFYILSSLKHLEAMALLGGDWERLKLKYLMSIEEYIPSNSRPRFDFTWNMMGKKTWLVPLVMRSGTLLNGYRKLDPAIQSINALELWNTSAID